MADVNARRTAQAAAQAEQRSRRQQQLAAMSPPPVPESHQQASPAFGGAQQQPGGPASQRQQQASEEQQPGAGHQQLGELQSVQQQLALQVQQHQQLLRQHQALQQQHAQLQQQASADGQQQHCQQAADATQWPGSGGGGAPKASPAAAAGSSSGAASGNSLSGVVSLATYQEQMQAMAQLHGQLGQLAVQLREAHADADGAHQLLQQERQVGAQGLAAARLCLAGCLMPSAPHSDCFAGMLVPPPGVAFMHGCAQEASSRTTALRDALGELHTQLEELREDHKQLQVREARAQDSRCVWCCPVGCALDSTDAPCMLSLLVLKGASSLPAALCAGLQPRAADQGPAELGAAARQLRGRPVWPPAGDGAGVCALARLA